MTHLQVAEWMVEELNRVKFLYQEDAVWKIFRMFGKEYTYENDNGNLAIDKKVLKEFRKLTEDYVVWERGEKMWRARAAYDPKGKRQSE